MPYHSGLGLGSQLSGLASLEPEPEEPGLFRRYVTRPASKLFGRTASLVPELLLSNEGLGIAPEAYRLAEEEKLKAAQAEDPNVEQGAWETLPGLGDVLTAGWQPESAMGRVGKLGVELGGNLALDPTTWLGPGLAKAGARVMTSALPMAKAAAEAGQLAPELAATIGKIGTAGAEALPEAEKILAIRNALQAAGTGAAKLRLYDLYTNSGMAANAALAGLGAAFLPDVGSAALQAGQAAVDAAKQGEWAEAAGDTALGGLMGALGVVAARGLREPFHAANAFREALKARNPELGAKAEQAAADLAVAQNPQGAADALAGQQGWQGSLPKLEPNPVLDSNYQPPPPDLNYQLPTPDLTEYVPGARGPQPTVTWDPVLPPLGNIEARMPPPEAVPVSLEQLGELAPPAPVVAAAPEAAPLPRAASFEKGTGQGRLFPGAKLRKLPVEEPAPAPEPVGIQLPIDWSPPEPPAPLAVVAPPAPAPAAPEAGVAAAPAPAKQKKIRIQPVELQAPAAAPPEAPKVLSVYDRFKQNDPEIWKESDRLHAQLDAEGINPRSKIPADKRRIEELVPDPQMRRVLRESAGEWKANRGKNLTTEEAISGWQAKQAEQAAKAAEAEAAAAPPAAVPPTAPVEAPAPEVPAAAGENPTLAGLREMARQRKEAAAARLAERAKGKSFKTFANPLEGGLDLKDAAEYVVMAAAEKGLQLVEAIDRFIRANPRFANWRDKLYEASRAQLKKENPGFYELVGEHPEIEKIGKNRPVVLDEEMGNFAKHGAKSLERGLGTRRDDFVQETLLKLQDEQSGLRKTIQSIIDDPNRTNESKRGAIFNTLKENANYRAKEFFRERTRKPETSLEAPVGEGETPIAERVDEPLEPVGQGTQKQESALKTNKRQQERIDLARQIDKRLQDRYGSRVGEEAQADTRSPIERYLADQPDEFFRRKGYSPDTVRRAVAYYHYLLSHENTRPEHLAKNGSISPAKFYELARASEVPLPQSDDPRFVSEVVANVYKEIAGRKEFHGETPFLEQLNYSSVPEKSRKAVELFGQLQRENPEQTALDFTKALQDYNARVRAYNDNVLKERATAKAAGRTEPTTRLLGEIPKGTEDPVRFFEKTKREYERLVGEFGQNLSVRRREPNVASGLNGKVEIVGAKPMLRGKSKGPKLEGEADTFQYTADNGVRLQLTTEGKGVGKLKVEPSPGGESVVTRGEAEAITLQNITESGQHTAEDIAAAIEQLRAENPNAGILRVPYQSEGDALRWAVSPKVEKALDILEKKGLIRRAKQVVKEVEPNQYRVVSTNPATAVVGEGEHLSTAHVGRAQGSRVPVPPLKEEFIGPQQQTNRGVQVGGQPTLGDRALLQRMSVPVFGEGSRGGIRKPAARIYVIGKDGPERVVANSAREPRERLPLAVQRVRDAADLEAFDNALKVGSTSARMANVEGTYTPEELARLAGVHEPLVGPMQAIHDEAAQLMEMAGVKFSGFMASPFRHAMILGEDLRNGQILLNPSGALHWAQAQGGGVREAAEHMLGDMWLHEWDHALRNSVEEAPHSVAQLVEWARAAEPRWQRWVDQLAKEENWAGIKEEAANYARLMEKADGRYREGSFGGDAAGQPGVRAGAPEGRAPSTPDLAAQGPYGAAAGGGAGLRAGQPLPGSGGGAAGGLGRAADLGAGGYGLGGGSAPAEVSVAGGGGEGSALKQRQIANRVMDAYRDRPPNEEQTKRAIEEFIRNPSPPDELVVDGYWLARRQAQLLREKVDKGGNAAESEMYRRQNAKPTGKGAAHSYLNNLHQNLDPDAKATMSFFSELLDKHPQLAERFGLEAQQPVQYQHIDDLGRRAFNIRSDSDLVRLAKSGKKLSLADIQTFRYLGQDIQDRIYKAEAVLTEKQLAAEKLTGAERDAYVQNELIPAEKAFFDASTRLVDIAHTINQGTKSARELAIRRWNLEATDPKRALYSSIMDRARTLLQSRYRNPAQLEKQLADLGAKLRVAIDKNNFLTEGFKTWHAEFQKANQFTLLDKIIEFYKGGLLGWPSRVANIQSNALFAGYRQMEKTVAAMVDKAYSGVTKEARDRYVQEGMLSRMILADAMRQHFPAWRTANLDAIRFKPMADTLGKFTQEAMEDFIRVPQAIQGTKGEVLRSMFKFMNADDALFKGIAKSDAYYRQVYRNIRNGVEGFAVRPGESAYEATHRIVQDIYSHINQVEQEGGKWNSAFKEIHEAAVKQALEETFQTELPTLVKSFQNMLYQKGWGQAGQFFVPFVKTPWNIAAEVWKRTPFDWPRIAMNWGEMTKGERVDALARGATSTALGLGVLALVDSGGIEMTGSGPVDPEQNALLKESGWAPYSLKVADKWYSYQRLEPVSSLLGMVADLVEGHKQGDFEKLGTGVQKVAGSVAENLTNKTFLSGLENVVLAYSDPMRNMEQFLKSTMSGFVPNSIGYIPFGHLAKAIDPTYREVGANPKDIVMSKVPGLSFMLPAQLSPTGGERQRPETLGPRWLSPNVGVAVKQGPEADAARMLAGIGFPVRRIRQDIMWKGLRVPISGEEQRALAQAQQQAMQYIGGRLMKDPTFLALPDNDEDAAYPGQKTKKDVLERAMNRYRKPVLAAMQGQLRQRAGDRLQQAQLEKARGGA